MASPSGILTGFLNSPRKQRRFMIVSAAVLVIGASAFLAMVVFRGTPNAFTDTISNKPATLYHPDKTVKLQPEETALARKFIKTAVERQNLDAAYELVHADLKGNLTRKQWDTGNIPVVTYPARNADTAAFTVDYSFKTSALLEVDLVARPGQDQRPELRFFIGLKRAGGKPDGRWLVNYWQPHWRPPVPQAVG
jgi:hypothetical protein